jgi:hypothetical protein
MLHHYVTIVHQELLLVVTWRQFVINVHVAFLPKCKVQVRVIVVRLVTTLNIKAQVYVLHVQRVRSPISWVSVNARIASKATIVPPKANPHALPVMQDLLHLVKPYPAAQLVYLASSNLNVMPANVSAVPRVIFQLSTVRPCVICAHLEHTRIHWAQLLVMFVTQDNL